ncbi:unnamed protein product, partial [Polarella glacialis]
LVMTALLLPTAFRTPAATAHALSTPALALKLAAQLDKCQDVDAKDMAEQEYLTDEQRATLAEARRQLRDAGPRGAQFCAGLPAEEGAAAVPCQFGPEGKRARTHVPGPCLFCDVTKLNEAFLNRSADVVRARYNKLTAAAKAMAVDRVTEPEFRQWLATGTGQRLCTGLADPREDCVFALSRAAAAAQTPGKKLRCLFCDPESMAKKCAKAKGLQQVKRDLLRMGMASRRKALEERVPAEHRAALRSVLQQPEPAAVRRADTSWVGSEPYTPEELEARYEAGRAKWAPVLAARALVALPDISAEQYRDQVVADRNKSLNMMNVPHERLPRGSEVSNEDPLPKACVTRLAANLQLWCEFNSWQVCPKCQLLQPRVLTPAGLDGLLEPWCGPKACRVCRGLQKPSVPQHESTPAELAGLSPAARAALCPVEAYYGPEVRARDRFGRGNGYREHSSMVRFSWHQLSVKDRIQELSEENRREATRALRWLLRQSGSEKTKSAYGEFYEEHREFLQRTPDATDRQRKRWLRFLEREGLECALWPDLFLDRQTCLTWVRMQSTSRQVAAHGSTLQERYFPLDEAAGEGDEPIEDNFAGTKRAYIALVLSPTLDYSCSYELLHFAYDLNLWTALGAKKNKGLPIPMRLLMRGHSFSEEFWKDMHLALVDLVRQKGFPPVFSTRSPLEWSFPYHVAVVNTMEKARRGRMLLPVHETLHQTHVLTQVGLNFEGGHNKPAERAKKGHEQQLLKLRRPDGGQVKLTSFQRVEFQDGKRKAPTQDYHGSGRAHSHSLEFVGKENRAADLAALQLDLCVSASGSSGDVLVDGYVQASQKDRQGRTPWLLHEGESHFDKETGRYVLRHTKQDVEDGIRGYYPATMAVTKCHEDVQLCYDDENYTLYTTAYAPKFSDSMRRELLNDDADADSIAASVLMRYKPCEPEMILQLFGAMFRQWRVTTVSGGKRSFTVPVPDNPDQPREVRLYQQCSWRSEDMSMLEFLRKSNNEGGICGWLLELHRKSGSTASLAAFANTYKMQGEKIVACDMYLGMCLACEHAVARSHWHTPRLELLMDEDMKLEARTRIYRQQVAARLAPHVKKVLAYLEGTALKPADPTAQELRAQQQPARKRHQLPIQRRYEQLIDAGEKTVEGRINHGAAARVMEGDILVLGSTPSLVQAIYTYQSFSAMLEDLGVENALPDVDTLEEALEIYHGFNNYETLARVFGVRAFLLAPVPAPAEADEAPEQATEWNAEQERWAMIVEEDIKRAAAVFSATTERAADEAREETWNHNKIRALEGPPGTGKTTIARYVVELAETYGLKVLWSVYTAQLASRMREVFGDRIDINTCHAALGFDEEYHNVSNALQGYGLVVIDEFSQLQGKHIEHIDKLRSASDRVAAFVLLGDKCQLAGFGTERVWHTRAWRESVQATELHQLFRCKDPAFRKILACLRTAKPSETGCRGGVSVPDIMRHRRAWHGHYPTVEAVRSILMKHKNTTMLTVSPLYPRRAPLAVVSADIESNPENYNENKELKPVWQLACTQLPLHEGMQVYFTRNVDKSRDYVNGMRGTIRSWDASVQALEVRTATGHDVQVFRWTDTDLGNKVYFPIRAGYASTIIKFAGAELPHVTLWLDKPHVPGAAYTGMSRVAYGRDLLIGGAGTCRWCDPPALALFCRNAAGRQSLCRDLRFFREHDIQALPAARFPPGRERELVMTALLLPTAFRTPAATAHALSTPALALKLAAQLDKCQDVEAKDMAEQEYLTDEQRATLAEARRQLRDAGPRGAQFCAGLPAEEGAAAVPCQFGPEGKRARTHVPGPCLFCDVTKLNEAFLNRSADVVRARYNKLTAAAKAMAVDRVTEPEFRQWLATGTGQRLCTGLADPREDCVFALSRAAAAAQTPGKKLRCLFCDPESMAKKCAKAKGLQQVKRDLLRMGMASRRKALEERVPAEHRAALRSVLQQPEPAAVRRADTSWVGSEPYTPEELEARYEAGRAKWAPVLAARALVALPDISAEQYRDQVVADRNKSLNMMNVPHERLPRGSEVSNEDPLPKACVTRLAANLQLWCEFNSWQVCPKCQLLQPRVLTPAGLDGLLEPWCGPKACRVCRGLQKPSVPQHESTPAELAGLSPAARAALCPVEAYYGPEVRARDRFGRGNGYREHSSMVRFSWHQLSVEDRIQELSEENRREEHHEFLQRTPDATDRQRKRWLRFLEREGLECALWPDLFLDRQTCLTWVRMQSTSRQVAAHGSTLQERYFPLDEAAGEGDEPIEDTFASTKRAYIALVLSPTLDYSCSYELLHFAYDLNLWTALGAKKNKGLPIPMRLLMRGHSFSEEFWKDMHRALVDLVRQKGFPPVFSTRSPLEWSFPYHVAVVNTMEKARRGRMLLPVHETLHQTHVLTQVGLNFEGGHNKPAERAKKGHEQQLLKLRRPDGGQVKLTSFQRVEFQDGKRKAPTQDYHGSGRAHSHSLEFVGKENRAADLAALQLDLCVSASGSSGDVLVDGYVQASQKDRQGRTPWLLHEGESHFDKETGRYVLRHTKQDVEDGIRGYYPATMAVTKCHEDVQLCYDDENYTLYTTAYAPKFSDSMRRELLNDDADADSIAASVLMRYKPCEPEMILQLFGAMFRQWRVTTVSGGKRSFTVPVPDNPDQPREVRLYQQCSWRSEDMSMLEFLRKSNNEGGICGWLLELHRKSGSTASLAAFANTYKMQGEKIVACDMVSRMNDKYYGQWLVLHVPFSSVTDFVKPNVLLLVPAADKYLGMCLACEHAVARSHWHTPRLELLMDEDMKLEARTRIYRQQVAARLAPHVKKVLAYLEGTALKPADPTAQELRAQQQPARKRHQLPIQRRYEQLIDAGEKTVEGRINHGAAARVMEGDILVLGSTPSLVQAIYTYQSFSAMLEDLGVENALPDVDTLEEALEIYHGFNNYETLARVFGVRAFLLAPVPAPAEADEAPEQATEWNAEQERWAMIVEEDIKRAAAVFSATTERAADEAREETWNHNKIRALEGPPGTGKTTIARYVVELAETYGLKVLWSVYTAQLASRMREVFGDRIDINTCHAALGFDEEYHNVSNALQGYGLVVIDEFSQLQGKHIEHIDKLRSASDRVAAFVLLGDKCQLAGFGTERVWHTRAWRESVQATELHQLFRCKDPAFRKILACLRTAKPSETGCRGGVSVPDIMRHRRAWHGHYPTVEAVRSILMKHKNTTMLTVSRQGSAALNGLSLQALYPRRAPLAVVSADIESNPENYNENKELKPVWQLACTQLPLHEGMQVYFTRNVDKSRIRALEGPPGTGKTTIARYVVELAETYGLKVLWSVYTAQLASRMREVFGDRIDINTCHAALGFDEEYHNVSNALQGYGLVVIDEFSQLQGKHIEHIDKLRSASDRVAAFVLLGDKCQLAGFGTERVWHTRAWRESVQATELHQLFRCKDPAFRKILACLRTAKPSETGCRGGVSVPDIMRHRRAWHGHYPTVEAVRTLYPRRAPLAVVSADIESNPENYNENKELKPVWQLACTQLPLHEGMQVYFTRNVDKSRDYVNGMRGTIRSWDASVQALEVRTATGHDVQVFRWTDTDLGNKVYFPIRAGYASTIIKFAGAELPHVTLWLDKPHVPGAAYTGMSRVAYGRDLLIGGNLTKDHFTPAT